MKVDVNGHELIDEHFIDASVADVIHRLEFLLHIDHQRCEQSHLLERVLIWLLPHTWRPCLLQLDQGFYEESEARVVDPKAWLPGRAALHTPKMKSRQQLLVCECIVREDEVACSHPALMTNERVKRIPFDRLQEVEHADAFATAELIFLRCLFISMQ